MSPAIETCAHFTTVFEPGYGWIFFCEPCGVRETAEHSDECMSRAILSDKPCICGAEGEFQKHENRRKG